MIRTIFKGKKRKRTGSSAKPGSIVCCTSNDHALKNQIFGFFVNGKRSYVALDLFLELLIELNLAQDPTIKDL